MLFNYRGRHGLEPTAKQNELPAINSPSAGDDEKTTWGWFNTLRCNNGMISLPLRCATCVCASCLLCLYLWVPSAVITFVVPWWQRWIINWQRRLLNLSILLFTHQSSSWTLCFWSHHLRSDGASSGLKKKIQWSQLAFFSFFYPGWCHNKGWNVGHYVTRRKLLLSEIIVTH